MPFTALLYPLPAWVLGDFMCKFLNYIQQVRGRGEGVREPGEESVWAGLGLLLGVEVGGAGTESRWVGGAGAGGAWTGWEGGRRGQWGLGGEWGGGCSEPCYFLPHPSRDPRMHLPPLVSVLGTSAYP